MAAYWAGGDDDDDDHGDGDSGMIADDDVFSAKEEDEFAYFDLWSKNPAALVFVRYGQLLPRKMVNRSAMWSIGQLDGNLVDGTKVKNCTMLFNLSWVKS